jgi:hypothetical protein
MFKRAQEDEYYQKSKNGKKEYILRAGSINSSSSQLKLSTNIKTELNEIFGETLRLYQDYSHILI